MMSISNVLLHHGYIAIPTGSSTADQTEIVTVLMNLAYYGYALNVEGYEALSKLNSAQMAEWWKEVEVDLKDITGASRKIGDFVVYKNFPGECLAKSEADYWGPQILMYWGFPTSFFVEPIQPREQMKEQPKAKVLLKAKAGTVQKILGSHLRSPARWKEQELAEVLFLVERFPVNFSTLVFKENMVRLAVALMESGRKVNIETATDVLRLAAGLSDGDVSLREKVQFKSFKKPMRRFLLGILEGCANLAEDVARREELWKRFLHNLHAGDYRKRFPKVCAVVDDLYNGRLVTFNTKVETLLKNKDPEVLNLLASRPGDFRRRLVHTLDLFGDKAADAFVAVVDKLTTIQVVALRRYLETVNERYNRCFPPKGNWGRLQIGEARWVEERHVKAICDALGKVLKTRIPKVKSLDPATAMIKLPNSGGEEGPYARGTVFPIPEGTDFIRTASYWSVNNKRYTWYDNGWNFFSDDWKPLGACCWSEPFFPSQGWSWYSKRKQSEELVSEEKSIFIIDFNNLRVSQVAPRCPLARAIGNVIDCYMALEVVITEWALQSYLDLKYKQTFTNNEYWSTLRPDVERLKNFPSDPQFSVNTFWGPATLRGGVIVPDGFKMKWHNVGQGRVQLRLCVAIVGSAAYLCQAFVKTSDSQDKREAAKLLSRISNIKAGRYIIRGKI